VKNGKNVLDRAGRRACNQVSGGLFVVGPGFLEGFTDAAMGKPPLLEEAHLLGPGLRIGWWRAVLAPQHLRGAVALPGDQIGLQFGDGFTFDTMAVKFGDDALIAVARRAAMHERFGKTFLGKETGLLQPLQERVDVIALLRVRGKLTRKFLATMLT